MTAETHLFAPDGAIPNSPLPLAFWSGRLPHEAREGPIIQSSPVEPRSPLAAALRDGQGGSVS